MASASDPVNKVHKLEVNGSNQYFLNQNSDTSASSLVSYESFGYEDTAE